jgi:hypothetical protein
MMTSPRIHPHYALFNGERLMERGPLDAVLQRAKALADAEPDAVLLFLDEHSGRSRDFDLRGPLDQVLARALPPVPPRGPGRPRLGVLSREVSLLPRHWDWLDQQPQGASAALRRLVDAARQAEPDKARARRVRDAVGRSMTELAGDRPGFEEAYRALDAKDGARFKAHTKAWPKDLRRYLLDRVAEAEALEKGSAAP